MNVTNFTSNRPTGTDITVPANGNVTTAIGATLNVPANQPPGEYSGTYTITVNY